MDLVDRLGVFAAAAEAGSFSAAARRLGIEPSSVSRTVAGLEQEFGVPLMARTTRRLALTEAGALCLERARAVIADLDELRAELGAAAARPRGLLRINAPVSFGHRHVAPHLPAFLACYPELGVELTLSDHRVDLVEAGADLAIRIGALPDSTLVARRLAAQRRVVCASRDYLRAAPPLEAPTDLAAHACLRFALQPDDLWLLDDGAEVSEIRVAGRLRANTSDALLEAARGGAGVALLPSWLAGAALAAGDLVRLLPRHHGRFERREQGIFGVWLPSRQALPKVRAFLDHLAGAIGRPPAWEAD